MGDTQGAFRALSPVADGGSAWDRYDLVQIWNYVCHEDGVPSYQQYDAWQTMAKLCTDQADQLQRGLDQLMTVWPPIPQSSAETLKQIMDGLIASMRESAQAAVSAQRPLSQIVLALSGAKDKIDQLRQQREQYLKSEDAYRHFTVSTAKDLPPAPPPNWQATLNNRARAIMQAADAAAVEAARHFVVPQAFGLGSSEVLRPVPGLPGHPSTTIRSESAPMPLEWFPLDAHEPGTDDPLLSGAKMPASLEIRSSVGSFIESPMGAVLAPGGVIGGVGMLPSTNASAGVTEALVAGRRTTTGSTTPMLPPIGRGMSGPTSGRPNVASGGRRRRRGDPADPWAPPPGVAAILEPAPEPDYHDPGPGVIGIDR